MRSSWDVKAMRAATASEFLKLGIVTVLAAVLLSACGGTKVYEATKTVVYNGSMYNLTDVKQVTTSTTGRLPNDEVVNLRSTNRKAFNQLLKQHGSIFVRMSFMLDDQELAYRADDVTSWSNFDRMRRDFDSAGKKIAGLMKKNKATQIELR